MSTLRVGIDTSALALSSGGTARHVRALLAELATRDDVELIEYSMRGAQRATKVARDVGWYRSVLPRLAARDRVDVLHCPTARAPARSDVPLVLTVHDLAVLRHPRTFNRWTRGWSARTLPGSLAGAAGIIAVSAFTRDELQSVLDIDPARVDVIPNGVGPEFLLDGPAARGTYVLCVATREPRKNLQRTVQGFLEAGLPEHQLRLVGPDGWGDVDLPSHARVRALGQLSDAELAAQYRGATCVVYASAYEGFGLPVLEAMACGTPVVASRGRPIAEFARDAYVPVDPLEPAAIAAGINAAVTDRARLAERGRERARAYTWYRVAAATADVYRRVADHAALRGGAP